MLTLTKVKEIPRGPAPTIYEDSDGNLSDGVPNGLGGELDGTKQVNILPEKKYPTVGLISMELPNQSLQFLHPDSEMCDGVVFTALVTISTDKTLMQETTQPLLVRLFLENTKEDGTPRYSWDG